MWDAMLGRQSSVNRVWWCRFKSVAFSTDNSSWRFSHCPLLLREGDTLQMEISLRDVNVCFRRVTSTWFSEILLCLVFIKSNQPKIILMPKRHVLSDKFYSPSPQRLWHTGFPSQPVSPNHCLSRVNVGEEATDSGFFWASLPCSSLHPELTLASELQVCCLTTPGLPQGESDYHVLLSIQFRLNPEILLWINCLKKKKSGFNWKHHKSSLSTFPETDCFVNKRHFIC